jgi:hypothetical protein
MEQQTLDFIKSLPLSDDTRMALMTTLEWEKELSWSDGYETAAEQTEDLTTDEPVAESFLEDRVGMYNQFESVEPRFTYGDVVTWLKEYKQNKGW